MLDHLEQAGPVFPIGQVSAHASADRIYPLLRQRTPGDRTKRQRSTGSDEDYATPLQSAWRRFREKNLPWLPKRRGSAHQIERSIENAKGSQGGEQGEDRTHHPAV